MKKNFTVYWIVILMVCFEIYPVIGQEDFHEFLKKVRLKTQQNYNKIRSIQFSGRTKTYQYVGYSPLNFKVIPETGEHYFDGYWTKPDSVKFVIKAKHVITSSERQQDVFEKVPFPNPLNYIYALSALDIVDEKNRTPIYPFAPGSEEIYDYKLDSEINTAGNVAYTVLVTARSDTVPAVEGTFQIDAEKYDVISSDIVFNDASSLTEGYALENHRVKTRKALWNYIHWLPMTVEEEFEVELWGLKARIHRIIEFDNYNINTEIPDTERLVDKKIVYEPDPEYESKLEMKSPYPNRLTKEQEEMLLREIETKFASYDLFAELLESEALAGDLLKLKMSGKVDEYYQIAKQISNFLNFNRVEGMKPYYDFTFKDLTFENSLITVHAGYGFKDKRPKGEMTLFQYLGDAKKYFLEGNIYNSVTFEEDMKTITSKINSLTGLLYKGDYRDYYYRKGGNISLGHKLTDNLALKFSFISQYEENASVNTRFSIFRYSRKFRVNPRIKEGKFNGIKLFLLYRTYDVDFDVEAEYTDHDNLGSDFLYRRIKANFRRFHRPSYNSELNLYLSGGYSAGRMPPQKWFDFGGKTFLNFNGNLRGLDYKYYTGDRMVSGIAEFTVKGAVLESLGVGHKYLKVVKLTFWGGFGWSSLYYPNRVYADNFDLYRITARGYYNEYGIGFGDILNIFRIDFINRSLSGNEIIFGFNILR